MHGTHDSPRFVYDQPPFVKWTAEESRKKACAVIKAQSDARLAEVKKQAHAAGGAACLSQLQTHFNVTSVGAEERLEWQTDEARRAAISPLAEPCISSLEDVAKAGRYGALYSDLRGSKLEGSALTPEQNARLGTLQNGLSGRASDEYAARADKVAQEPAAAALYLAAAARMAGWGGDAERADTLLDEAKKAVARAGIKERLTVSLSGEGLGSDVVERVRKRGLATGLELASAGEHSFHVRLAPATVRSGRKDVTLSTSIRIQKGTRTNPEWTSRHESCETLRRRLDRSIESCNRNGPKNVNCKSKVGEKKDLDFCEERLGRLKKEIPAFAEEHIDYDAILFNGHASGKITLREGAGTPATVTIATSIERHKHGSVPRTDVSARSASPVTESELRDAYVGAPADHVDSRLGALASSRAVRLLATAKEAGDGSTAAADLVRYAVVAKNRPGEADCAALSTQLDVPVKATLELLLGRGE